MMDGVGLYFAATSVGGAATRGFGSKVKMSMASSFQGSEVVIEITPTPDNFSDLKNVLVYGEALCRISGSGGHGHTSNKWLDDVVNLLFKLISSFQFILFLKN